jgi:DNA-binding SARP family transcriptional activator
LGIWATDLPEHPRAALHNAVSRLRRALGTENIETTDRGYRFQVDPSELDLLRFDRLTALAARLESAGRTADAIAALDDALALWRTPLLGNVESATLRRALVPRLVDRYLATVEARAALRLRTGRHDGLADELADLVRQHPFREALVGWLMTALIRSGRQAEALAAYEALSRSLADELGIVPLGLRASAASHIRLAVPVLRSMLETSALAIWVLVRRMRGMNVSVPQVHPASWGSSRPFNGGSRSAGGADACAGVAPHRRTDVS